MKMCFISPETPFWFFRYFFSNFPSSSTTLSDLDWNENVIITTSWKSLHKLRIAISGTTQKCLWIKTSKMARKWITNTVWKVSKYGVFSGPFFPVFSTNKGKYGPEKLRIWTLFTHCKGRKFLNIFSNLKKDYYVVSRPLLFFIIISINAVRLFDDFW